ncbi:YadA-like family protein [Erwinia persicina]|uniref:YadA C-terminal domain-containing protein n=1 Tax=Erwinia persicina TaxID=55211 RepID=UPI003CCC865A
MSKLSTDISSGKTGVTQIDGDKIVFNDGGKGTTTLDVGGRNVANIKEGELSKNSKDAVNGSQLFETNTHVEQNTANIEINRTDINKNKTDIANNSSKITNLENAFSGMNHSFRSLAKEVNKNKKRADAGIAGAMAMTAIPHVYSDDFSFGMSMSGYRDQGALAAGVTFKTSEHTAMKVNSSWDTQNGAGVAAGFAWGW